MTKTLVDYCLVRSSELSCILAGCLGIDPLWTLDKLENLPDEMLTDNQACRFILGVKTRRNEFVDKDPEEQSGLVVRIASELHLLHEYCTWIMLPMCLYEDAPAAILELKKLSIAKETISDLQGWIRKIEVVNQ